MLLWALLDVGTNCFWLLPSLGTLGFVGGRQCQLFLLITTRLGNWLNMVSGLLNKYIRSVERIMRRAMFDRQRSSEGYEQDYLPTIAQTRGNDWEDVWACLSVFCLRKWCYHINHNQCTKSEELNFYMACCLPLMHEILFSLCDCSEEEEQEERSFLIQWWASEFRD